MRIYLKLTMGMDMQVRDSPDRAKPSMRGEV
jgi:hypothetical protein